MKNTFLLLISSHETMKSIAVVQNVHTDYSLKNLIKVTIPSFLNYPSLSLYMDIAVLSISDYNNTFLSINTMTPRQVIIDFLLPGLDHYQTDSTTGDNLTCL